jgi:hypothetical protein
MGLLLPGMTPDMLGEVYDYGPSLNEVMVGVGVWGVGALAFTLMAKVAMAIDVGELRYKIGAAARQSRRLGGLTCEHSRSEGRSTRAGLASLCAAGGLPGSPGARRGRTRAWIATAIRISWSEQALRLAP